MCCSLSADNSASPLVVRILNKKSGQYITVGPNKNGSGGVMLVQQPKSEEAGQKWLARVVPPSPGTSNPSKRFIFISTGEDKAMGIRYQSSITGAPACLWWPEYGPTETFVLTPAEGDWVYLENFTSRKFLGVLGASEQNGAQVVQWSQNKSDDQKWKIEPVKTKSK